MRTELRRMAWPRALVSVAVLGRARRWYPFLLDHHRDDLLQIAAVVRLLAPHGGVEESRVADRELYALARQCGYVRPAAGLRRGSSGKWVRW